MNNPYPGYDPSGYPPPPPGGFPPPPTGYPQGPDPNVAAKVSGPGMGLIIYGAISALFSVISLLLNLLGAGMSGMSSAFGSRPELAGMFSGAVGVISALLGLAFAGVILFGGMKMRSLESYGLAMAAAVLTMLPCSCCCIIGLPLGIWALVVLLKPEVKAAFQ